MKRIGRKRLLFVAILAMGMLPLFAQTDSTPLSSEAARLSISNETENLFRSLMPHRDSTFIVQSRPRDTFGKRFSFHFNMLEWALTLPNVGVEFDLNPTEKNNRSLMVWGRLNPKTTHSQTPRVVFDVASAMVEFRKYWRTGSIGKGRINHRYERIQLKQPKSLTRQEFEVVDYDSIPYDVVYYANAADSALAEKYNGDPGRSWFYNQYYRFRRNVTSTRTLRNPRNWRAYYLGVFAGFDKFDVCVGKKGRKGNSLSVGASVGWSIPLLTRHFPNEGGLDLDLGALIGPRAIKYDAYRFSSNSEPFQADASRSQTSWTISKNPIQQVRVALVYRLRSISRKVSLSLVDDYQTRWVDPYGSGRDASLREASDRQAELLTQAVQQHAIDKQTADSLAYWQGWHTHRLLAALQINPDTVFHNADSVLYEQLMKPSSQTILTGRQLKAKRKEERKAARRKEQTAATEATKKKKK